VKLMPAEELIWQKAFIMERERFDGADIVHIIRKSGPNLDWRRLVDRFGQYWPLLFSYLVFYVFVYPSERDAIPREILQELSGRLNQSLDSPPPDDKVCQGTLVSRAQYLLDIGQYGYADARLQPRGNMTPEDAIYWTWAIEHIR